MPWVRFIADYDRRISPHAVLAYKAGKIYLVSQATAAEAVAARKAVRAERPDK